MKAIVGGCKRSSICCNCIVKRNIVAATTCVTFTVLPESGVHWCWFLFFSPIFIHLFKNSRFCTFWHRVLIQIVVSRQQRKWTRKKPEMQCTQKVLYPPLLAVTKKTLQGFINDYCTTVTAEVHCEQMLGFLGCFSVFKVHHFQRVQGRVVLRGGRLVHDSLPELSHWA